MTLFQRLLAGSVTKLVRAACMFALLGLALMSYSILDPRAIPVIVAMSLGHAFGFTAFGCYLLAVIIDVRRGGHAHSHPPPPAPITPTEAELHSDTAAEVGTTRVADSPVSDPDSNAKPSSPT